MPRQGGKKCHDSFSFIRSFSELLPSAFCLDLRFLSDAQPFLPHLLAPKARREANLFHYRSHILQQSVFHAKNNDKTQLTLAWSIRGTLLTVAKAQQTCCNCSREPKPPLCPKLSEPQAYMCTKANMHAVRWKLIRQRLSLPGDKQTLLDRRRPLLNKSLRIN